MEYKSNSFLTRILKGIQYRLKQFTGNKYKKAGLNWFKIKYLKHLPYKSPDDFSPRVFQLNGSKVFFQNGPELLHSLQEIFVDEIYKIEFRVAKPYIIDCGSNIGLAIHYLKTRHPEARVVAFEPDKLNYSLLSQNIKEAGFTSVDARNEAIWKEDTYLNFKNEGNLSSKITDDSNNENIVSVKATRLKNLLSGHVDFLKIDIEGAEYEVLKDCSENLQNVDFLFIEFHGFFDKQQELNEILQIVSANNFAYYIKEASSVYSTPFYRDKTNSPYDIQLNIFCFKNLT